MEIRRCKRREHSTEYFPKNSHYEGILNLRCFKINTAIRSFFTGINRPYNLCQDCFYSTTLYQQELFEEIVDWHLSARNEDRIFDCSECHTIIDQPSKDRL